MLHSYSAELHDSHLIWIDRKPANPTKQRVLVVLEEPVASPSDTGMIERGRVFQAGKGCLGAMPREQVLAQLSHMRQDWDRSPLAGQASAVNAPH